MGDIQRYAPWPQEWPLEDPNGDLVTYEDHKKIVDALEAKVEKLRGKIRDWEARIDACEWSTNSSLTEDIRAEMRATLTTEEPK